MKVDITVNIINNNNLVLKYILDILLGIFSIGLKIRAFLKLYYQKNQELSDVESTR